MLIAVNNAAKGMAETLVHDWINEYKLLEEAEIFSFGNTILQNNELIQAVFTILEEKRHHQEFLEPVCEQLFQFYQSKDENLQRFCRQYIPCLIGSYLGQVAKGTRKNVRCIEVLLLGIYNLEVVDPSGKPIVMSFRIPSIAKPSIYHERMNLSHPVLTEDALCSLEYAEYRKFSLGPYEEVEKINASNRLQVMTVLMWLYNQHIGFMTSYSHMSMCKMCTRVVKQGYNRSNRSNYSNDCSSSYGNPHPRPIARIPLSTPMLLEMVYAVYFAMFNGMASIGLQSLEELHNRATHEMLSDVLLVTNAIRNSLKVNPSGQPNDGPMGISISLSPTTVISSVSRAITNASFRTKKLPDDIPIQSNGEANDAHQLSAINEEENAEVNVSSAPVPPRSKKQANSGITNHTASTVASKMNVLQLRKNKDKRKELPYSEANGSSRPFPSSNSSHSDISSDQSEDSHLSRFVNSDQTPVRHTYPYRIEPKSSFTNNSSSEGNRDYSDDRLHDGKVMNNFSNPDLNSMLKSDVKFIIQSGFHKSESANGIQSSSMQTAV